MFSAECFCHHASGSRFAADLSRESFSEKGISKLNICFCRDAGAAAEDLEPEEAELGPRREGWEAARDGDDEAGEAAVEEDEDGPA